MTHFRSERLYRYTCLPFQLPASPKTTTERETKGRKQNTERGERKNTETKNTKNTQKKKKTTTLQQKKLSVCFLFRPLSRPPRVLGEEKAGVLRCSGRSRWVRAQLDQPSWSPHVFLRRVPSCVGTLFGGVKGNMEGTTQHSGRFEDQVTMNDLFPLGGKVRSLSWLFLVVIP